MFFTMFFIISLVGTFEYILVISKDANFNFDHTEFQVSHLLNGQYFLH